MFDIFLSEDARKLMKKKKIVFLGDSNVRALYKDFLCLLKESKFIPQRVLKNKMENTVYGDELVYHGKKSNGRNYREEREASISSTHVSFFFLTKVYDYYVEDVVDKITRRSKPDVIIINSCVWDITRWGCDGVYQFKDNLTFLMKKFRRLIPNCLVIWVTTPPVAAEMKGGFLVKELQFLKYSMRFHVVEANHFARKVVVDNGFDVLDSHFHLQMQIHNRSHDGIHWEPRAVRYVTNLILRHISLSWNVPLPHRYTSTVVDENLVASEGTKNLKIEKVESKKSVVKVKFSDSKESVISKCNGKLESAVITVTGQENSSKKRRRSIQLYKVPKREESIHSHIARKEKKARKKRIRHWRKSIEDDSLQSGTKILAYEEQDQRSALEASLSINSFKSDQPNFNAVTPLNYSSHTPVKNSHKSFHCNATLIISPSQIPLPPSSPPHHLSSNCQRQSPEPQPTSFNRSNNFKPSPIISPSQIPLPPYSPGHCPPNDSLIPMKEYQTLPLSRTVNFNSPLIDQTPPLIDQAPCPSYNLHYNQLDNAAPQRRVIDWQPNMWSNFSFTNNANGRSSFSQDFFPSQHFSQSTRRVDIVNSSLMPHTIPNFMLEQSFRPRYNFVNDELPNEWMF